MEAHLVRSDRGLIVDDLQSAGDPGVPVGVAPRRAVKIKDHHFPMQRG